MSWEAAKEEFQKQFGRNGRITPRERQIFELGFEQGEESGIQWRPIETCPKSKRVLLWHEDIGWREGHWSGLLDEWCFGLEDEQPTHWAEVTGPEVGA